METQKNYRKIRISRLASRFLFRTLIFLLLLNVGSSYSQTLEFARTFINQNNDLLEGSISVDNQNNHLVLGSFVGVTNLAPAPLMDNRSSVDTQGAYGRAAYIVKSDSARNYIWGMVLKGASDYEIEPLSMETDSEGNIIIIGEYRGTIDLDPGPGRFELIGESFPRGEKYSFVLKLNSDGEFLWAHSFEFTYRSLDIDPFNEIVLSGVRSDSLDFVDFDPGPGSFFFSTGTSGGGFIQKLDASGNFLWANQAVSNSQDEVYIGLLVADSFGNIFTEGATLGDISFNTPNGIDSISVSDTRRFICKLTPGGQPLWAKGFSAMLTSDLEIDTFDNVYLSGKYQEFQGRKVDFDPGPNIYHLPDGGDVPHAFILKLNDSGDFVWAKGLQGGESWNLGLAVSLDNSVFATGFLLDTVDVDPGPGILNLSAGPAINVSNHSTYIMKLDDRGNLVWAYNFGKGIGNTGDGLAVDKYNNLYATGTIERGPFDLDPGPGVNNQSSIRSINDDRFFLILSEGICDGLTVVVDSLEAPTCAQMGEIYVSANGGLAPYQYNWSASFASNDSIAIVDTAGFYTVGVVDANSCFRSSTLYLPGPSGQNRVGFDLEANLIATDFRPGFDQDIHLELNLDGCTPVPTTLTFTLDSLLTFNFANPAPDTIIGDSLVWEFPNLSYDSLSKILVNVETKVTAMFGDSLCLNLHVLPETGDLDISNNKKKYAYEVINSYDPNDKRVNPSGACTENYVLANQRLTYTIRFQNTGNADAINVLLVDTLSSHLDIHTFQLIEQSHSPMLTEIGLDNTLKFRFDNINLPDSATHELESQGYVVFEIWPKSNLPNETTITNFADIYFDFNAPITTDPISITLVDNIPMCFATSINTFADSENINIYPNPVLDYFYLDTELENIDSIEIFTISGSLLKRLAYRNGRGSLASLPSGMYFMRISAGEKSITQKLIKY